MAALFPNTGKALQELLAPINPHTTRWLTSLDPLPVVHLYGLAAPGETEPWARADRFKIDCYDVDLDACEALANRCRDFLAGRSHGTSHGFLDHVWIETEPYMVPYPADDLVQFSFQIRVDVRATKN